MVITVSDRASRGEYADRSGPAVAEEIRRVLPECSVQIEVVPDGIQPVQEAFRRHPDADWILTTGGTGPGPRDFTPEATRAYVDRPVEGIAEHLRARSLEETPHAVFSRGTAGMRGRQFVVNLPGSEKGARFCAKLLAPLLEHGTAMARGEGH